MQSQHQQMIKNNLNKNTYDELSFQNLQAWKAKCKEFIQNALELIIQQRQASFGNANPSNPLNQVNIHNSFYKHQIQFGMHIENMNDIRMLLSAFDPKIQSTPQDDEEERETQKPLIQELFLDVIHTNKRIGSVLSERWNFALALSPQTQKSSAINADAKRIPESQKSGYLTYFKKMCVLLRSIRSLLVGLPSYNLSLKLKKQIVNLQQTKSYQDQKLEFLKDINQDLKTEYDLKYDDVELLTHQFHDQEQIKVKQLVSISNSFGDLSIEVQYIDQNDIIQNFQSLQTIKQEEESRRSRPTSQFQQTLFNALGPSNNNTLQLPTYQPTSSFLHQLRPSSQIGQINDQGRFRANSDNTFNQSIAQRALKQQYLINSRNNMNSPGPSDSILIKEDYFTAEKNKFYYQISNKHSDQSFQSAHSNKSSEFSKKGTPPYVPQLNCLPTTQGSSTVLKSSLEGGNGGFGNFESHDFHSSNRPSRPKIEPFKKFDNLNTSRNRNYRLSFDEGSKPMQSQRSFTSLFTPGNPTSSSFRKGSINMLFENSNSKSNKPQQQNQDEPVNDFDIIQNPFNISNSKLQSNSNNIEIGTSFEKTNTTTLNNEINPSSSQFYHVLPRKNSSIFKNEADGRASLNNDSIKRISSCSEMFPGGDPLFQIDEKKKYIGFLEESDEEKSQSEGTDSEDEDLDFMMKIDKYQNKLQIEMQKEQTIINTQSNKQEFQNDMRRNFFNLLQMREVILENRNYLRNPQIIPQQRVPNRQ